MGIISRTVGMARRLFSGGSAKITSGSVAQVLGGQRAGDWSSDHASETLHFTGWTYIALGSICKAAAQAKVVVNDSPPPTARPIRKSITGSVTDPTQQGEPLPDSHPLVRLLRRPNPKQSGAAFRYEQVLQLGLTGTCLIYNVKRNGITVERYIVPTAIAQPVRPNAIQKNGGYRIMPRSAAMRFDDDGFVMSAAYMAIMGQTIPVEDFTIIRWPHPLYKDDGLSPLSAGASWADLASQVDEARYRHNRNAFNPSAIIDPPDGVDADEGELARAEQILNAKYAGAENAGRIIVGAHGKVSVLGNTPREMAYEHGFEQMGAAMRALYGVPGAAVGLQDNLTYGAIAASLRQHSILAVQPYLSLIADEETEQLANPEFGAGLKVSMHAPSVDDPDLVERQLGLDLAAGTVTRGEIRKMRGRPLFGDERDDQVAGQFGQQEIAMQMQMQQMAQMQAMPAEPPPEGMEEQGVEPEGEMPPGAEAEGEMAEPTNRSSMPEPPRLRSTKTMIRPPEGIVMLLLPDDIAQEVLGLQAEINPDDVLEWEGEPHITVRYGVGGSVQDVQRAVAGFGTVAGTLGTLGLFRKLDRDVLYLSVAGGALKRLHDRIESTLPVAPNTYREFIPHVTVAYLKPGAGDKYLDLVTGLEEMPLAFSEAAYASPEGGPWRVGLIGGPSSAGVQVRAPVAKAGGGHEPACACDTCRKSWLASALDRKAQAERITELYSLRKSVGKSPLWSLMRPSCASGMCDAESYALTKRAVDQGITGFRVVQGSVRSGDKELPHTWLRHGSEIIDPTVGQFNGRIEYVDEDADVWAPKEFLKDFERQHGKDPLKQANGRAHQRN